MPGAPWWYSLWYFSSFTTTSIQVDCPLCRAFTSGSLMCGLFVPYCPGFAFATHHCRGVGPPARCCACTVTMPAPRQAATVSALCKRFMAAPVRKPALWLHSLPRGGRRLPVDNQLGVLDSNIVSRATMGIGNSVPEGSRADSRRWRQQSAETGAGSARPLTSTSVRKPPCSPPPVFTLTAFDRLQL